MAKNVVCTVKHTYYQPTDTEWVCPKCKTKPPDGWCVEAHEAEALDCELLHESDFMVCYECNHSSKASTWAARVAKQRGLVKCECCRGTGLVAAKKRGTP